jgi:hypothetical protein
MSEFLQYQGMRIVANPHLAAVAKIQISPDFEWITDEYRAEIDGWLLSMFGTKEPWFVVDGSAISFLDKNPSGKFMVTTEAGLEQLKMVVHPLNG